MTDGTTCSCSFVVSSIGGGLRALSTRHAVERGREGVVEERRRRGERIRDTSTKMSIY
jgi:hypothetical protein